MRRPKSIFLKMDPFLHMIKTQYEQYRDRHPVITLQIWQLMLNTVFITTVSGSLERNSISLAVISPICHTKTSSIIMPFQYLLLSHAPVSFSGLVGDVFYYFVLDTIDGVAVSDAYCTGRCPIVHSTMGENQAGSISFVLNFWTLKNIESELTRDIDMGIFIQNRCTLQLREDDCRLVWLKLAN